MAARYSRHRLPGDSQPNRSQRREGNHQSGDAQSALGEPRARRRSDVLYRSGELVGESGRLGSETGAAGADDQQLLRGESLEQLLRVQLTRLMLPLAAGSLLQIVRLNNLLVRVSDGLAI